MKKQLTIFMDSLVHYRLPTKNLIIFTFYFLLYIYSLNALCISFQFRISQNKRFFNILFERYK